MGAPAGRELSVEVDLTTEGEPGFPNRSTSRGNSLIAVQRRDSVEVARCEPSVPAMSTPVVEDLEGRMILEPPNSALPKEVLDDVAHKGIDRHDTVGPRS